MVRLILLSSTLVLLASCVQSPTVAPVPTPTVLSTDFNDGATGVATDADGNAYVVGYRNASLDAASSGNLGEIFVGRLNVAGDLQWLTRLANSVSPNSLYRKVAVAEEAIYVILTGLTGNSLSTTPFTLHKLDLDGTLLWSKDYFSAGEQLTGFAVTPDGRFYISRETAANEAFISAFNSAGAVQWEEVTSPGSYGLVAADDGSLYEANNFYDQTNDFRVSKRAADGTLQWSRPVTPSMPHYDGAKPNYITLYVEDNSVYAVTTFLERGRSVNKEVTRFDPNGNKVWSHVFVPQGQDFPECDAGFTHCVGVLGVSVDGSFYASRGDVLIRISATGERVETDGLGWYGDHPTARALARATLPEVGSRDILYEVGITGVDEVNSCSDGSDGPKECAYTDIYVQQSSLNQISSEDGSLAEVYNNLMWSSR